MLRDTLERAAVQYELDAVQTARLFAMGFTAAADGLIGCFDAKYHYLDAVPAHLQPPGISGRAHLRVVRHL